MRVCRREQGRQHPKGTPSASFKGKYRISRIDTFCRPTLASSGKSCLEQVCPVPLQLLSEAEREAGLYMREL